MNAHPHRYAGYRSPIPNAHIAGGEVGMSRLRVATAAELSYDDAVAAWNTRAALSASHGDGK